MTEAVAGTDAKKTSKRSRKYAKGIFHRYLNTFNAQLRDGAEEDAIVTIMPDLERAYSEVEVKHNALLEHYDSEEEDGDNKDQVEVKGLNDDMDTMYQELCQARHDVAVIKKKVKTQEESKRARDDTKGGSPRSLK